MIHRSRYKNPEEEFYRRADREQRRGADKNECKPVLKPLKFMSFFIS
jgi:hypothetical protein